MFCGRASSRGPPRRAWGARRGRPRGTKTSGPGESRGARDQRGDCEAGVAPGARAPGRAGAGPATRAHFKLRRAPHSEGGTAHKPKWRAGRDTRGHAPPTRLGMAGLNRIRRGSRVRAVGGPKVLSRIAGARRGRVGPLPIQRAAARRRAMAGRPAGARGPREGRRAPAFLGGGGERGRPYGVRDSAAATIKVGARSGNSPDPGASHRIAGSGGGAARGAAASSSTGRAASVAAGSRACSVRRCVRRLQRRRSLKAPQRPRPWQGRGRAPRAPGLRAQGCPGIKAGARGALERIARASACGETNLGAARLRAGRVSPRPRRRGLGLAGHVFCRGGPCRRRRSQGGRAARAPARPSHPLCSRQSAEYQCRLLLKAKR